MASPVRGASFARFLLAAPFLAASAGAAFASAAWAAPSIANAAEGLDMRVIVKLATPSGDRAGAPVMN